MRGEIRADLNVRLTAQIILGSLNSLPEWYRPRAGQSNAVVKEHFIATLLAGVAIAAKDVPAYAR